MCFSLVEAGAFHGCARCGRTACEGHCGALPTFASVTCAYAYRAPLSLLLREAKGRQRSSAIAAFEALISLRCKRHLAAVRGAHSIGPEDIHLSPLRWRRAILADWHPASLLLRATEGQGTIGWKLRWQTQASESARTRRARVAAGAYSPSEQRALGPHVRNVLLVDDVLTSGETALALARALRARPAYARACFHLFTLFRAPAEAESR